MMWGDSIKYWVRKAKCEKKKCIYYNPILKQVNGKKKKPCVCIWDYVSAEKNIEGYTLGYFRGLGVKTHQRWGIRKRKGKEY